MFSREPFCLEESIYPREANTLLCRLTHTGSIFMGAFSWAVFEYPDLLGAGHEDTVEIGVPGVV